MPDRQEWFLPEFGFSETFSTPRGVIAVEADVMIEGSQVVLKEFDYRPIDAPNLSIGVREVLRILREISDQAGREGYTTVVFDGFRISGRNPRRLVRYRRLTW